MYRIWHILKEQDTGHKILLSFIIALGCLGLFALIAEDVLDGDALSRDASILLTINAALSPQLDIPLLLVTHTGGAYIVGFIAVIATLVLAYRQLWRKLVFFVSSVGGALLLNLFLKIVFARERPDLWHHLVYESSYSFPSGHAMASSILAISLLILVWHSRWRVAGIVTAGIYMAGVGFSRLYLGVHYPSDVLAGWCLSAAWAATVYLIVLRNRRLAQPPAA